MLDLILLLGKTAVIVLFFGYLTPRILVLILFVAGLFTFADAVPLAPKPPQTDFLGMLNTLILAYPQGAVNAVSSTGGLLEGAVISIIWIVLAVPYIAGLVAGIRFWPEVFILRFVFAILL